MRDRRAINRTNKSRARSMEQQVAKYLSGQRVPMSGGGSMKGDVRVPSPIGDFLIECKLTEQTHKKNGPGISFEFHWLDKIQEEAAKTPSVEYGVVVIHFHREQYRDDFVFIPIDMYTRFYATAPIQSLLVLLDGRKQTMLYKEKLEEITPTLVTYKDTRYMLMRLNTFRDMLYAQDTQGMAWSPPAII